MICEFSRYIILVRFVYERPTHYTSVVRTRYKASHSFSPVKTTTPVDGRILQCQGGYDPLISPSYVSHCNVFLFMCIAWDSRTIRPTIVLYLVYRPVCKMVLTQFLSGIKFVGP